MDEVIYDFDFAKNLKLKTERGVSFEDIINIIAEDGVLDTIEHSNPNKYPKQKIFIVDVDGYVYLVPFVRNKNVIFLKSIFASRKETKRYLLQKKSGDKL